MSRRNVVGAGLAGAFSGLPIWFVESLRANAQPPAPQGANDRPGVGLVGCGGKGIANAKAATKWGEVLAVCDVDEAHVAKAKSVFPAAETYRDFRKLLERKDVDIVVCGTPDHWHTLVSLAAMRAGKDVYCEKPLTVTIDEGRRLVAAARETGRILQTGSQQRSHPVFWLACELVRSGRLGKLATVTSVLPAGPRGGPFKPTPAPAGLDWDMWLGPAPALPYIKERAHRFWRYWYELAGGTTADWGTHHNDIALWGVGLDRSGPISVEARPLAKPVPGGYSAIPEYQIEYVYENGVRHTCMSTTADGLSGEPVRPEPPGAVHHGVKFEGPEGWIAVTRWRIEASRPELLGLPLPTAALRLNADAGHMENFFDCVRTRSQPVTDVEIGHRAASVCHLGNIALRFPGRKLAWDPAREDFVNDKEASRHLARPMRKPWSYERI